MTTIYRRANISTSEVRQGTWEEICKLDKRIWSEPEEAKDLQPEEKEEAIAK